MKRRKRVGFKLKTHMALTTLKEQNERRKHEKWKA